MDSPIYGKSDIQWKKIEPKVFELSNKPPDQPAMQQALETASQQAEAKDMGLDEFFHYDKGMAMRERERPAGPAEARQERLQARTTRREHRRQLRLFDRYLAEGGPDPRQGVQELMDSGALRIGEDGGIYSSVPHGGNKDQLVNAVREWSAWQDSMINQYGVENDEASIEARRKAMEDIGERTGKMMQEMWKARQGQ